MYIKFFKKNKINYCFYPQAVPSFEARPAETAPMILTKFSSLLLELLKNVTTQVCSGCLSFPSVILKDLGPL